MWMSKQMLDILMILGFTAVQSFCKNIFYKNIEAEIWEILRIFLDNLQSGVLFSEERESIATRESAVWLTADWPPSIT